MMDQVVVAIVCRADGDSDPPRLFSTQEKATRWAESFDEDLPIVIYAATIDDPDELTRDRGKLS
jgi:hypothetical protein